MSEIVVTRPHRLGNAQARTVAQQIADRLGRQFGLHHAWSGDMLRFARSGLDGELAVGSDAITVRVRLGFTLSLFKPRIEAEIRRYLAEDLAALEAGSAAS